VVISYKLRSVYSHNVKNLILDCFAPFAMTDSVSLRARLSAKRRRGAAIQVSSLAMSIAQNVYSDIYYGLLPVRYAYGRNDNRRNVTASACKARGSPHDFKPDPFYLSFLIRQKAILLLTPLYFSIFLLSGITRTCA